jgi:c-di-GMP-binding flagellar brake protein YcgR
MPPYRSGDRGIGFRPERFNLAGGQPMAERRKFVRFSRKGLLKYRVLNIPKGLIRDEDGFYTNISGGGLLFESNKAFTSGTMLKLEIDLHDWARHLSDKAGQAYENQPLKILGEVVHCQELVPNHTYTIGVKFVGLDPKYQKAVIQYLEDSMKNDD